MFLNLKPVIKAALGVALAATVTTTAHAFEMDSLSDSERQAFRDEVRAYLLDNPEVLMEAIAVLEGRQVTAKEQADKTMVAELSGELFNDGRSYVGGNPDGDITLVEFLDYRCGYCRRAHDDVNALVYGDGNIRFIVKEFPILGEDSVTSSRFAIATRIVAGPEAYKRANDALMKLSGSVNAAALSRLARDLDLDGDAIMAEMDSAAVSEELNANHALAQKLAINGTPTFVLGDEVVRGYVPLDAMQALVAEARDQ
ncbi:DsbA family protein [Pseudoruegeria sp. SK021]|uniref:DsbA family protein n=1 Tax=Pseudoruegeria sp. SK021 TaxID=1933035 RepID=UPI000A21D4BE|nr:DsbA family protein [Pseudoruegeria sp. SK021]OSP56241.1 disulfide bond formation protein DsbA [Pseudoruegeria sp. SK021]